MGSMKPIFKKTIRKYRPLYAWIIIQCLIILFSISVMHTNRPVNLDNVETITVEVEDIWYSHSKGISSYRIYADSKEYTFPNYGIFGMTSVNELREAIQIGDRITMQYETRRGFFRSTNYILEAHSDTDTYCTFEEHEEQRHGGQIGIIICIVIVESIFIACFLFALWANAYNLRSILFKKLKKKQKSK